MITGSNSLCMNSMFQFKHIERGSNHIYNNQLLRQTTYEGEHCKNKDFDIALQKHAAF